MVCSSYAVHSNIIMEFSGQSKAWVLPNQSFSEAGFWMILFRGWYLHTYFFVVHSIYHTVWLICHSLLVHYLGVLCHQLWCSSTYEDLYTQSGQNSSSWRIWDCLYYTQTTRGNLMWSADVASYVVCTINQTQDIYNT